MFCAGFVYGCFIAHIVFFFIGVKSCVISDWQAQTGW